MVSLSGERGNRLSPVRQPHIRVASIREYCRIVPGAFTPVLAKHLKWFSLVDCISIGVDRMQRDFEPMRKQLEAWQSLHSHTRFARPKTLRGHR